MPTKVSAQSLVSASSVKDVYCRFIPKLRLPSCLSSRWRFTFRNLVKVADISAMGLAFLLAERVVTYAPAVDGAYLVAGSIGALLAFLCALQGRVYTRRSLQSFSAQGAVIIVSLLVGAAGQWAVLWRLQPESATAIVQWSSTWLGISGGLMLSFRIPLVLFIRYATRSGLLARRLAIIGATEQGCRIAAYVGDHKEEANRIVGIFDDISHLQACNQSAAGQVQTVGSILDLIALSRREQLDAIIIVFPLSRLHEIDALRGQIGCVVADVYVIPEIAGFSASTHSSNADMALSASLGGHPIINIIRQPLTDYQSIQKALFDRAVAMAALVALMPLMLLIALGVRLDSRGPIFFRQPRMGFNNVPFTVFKFRSMYHHMADILADRQTSRDDPRVTRVGRALRKLSFDELPQLINVLRGDMSLVGPRPHAPRTKAGGFLLEDVVPEYAERHRIKPGITGWAQVNGSRGEIKSVAEIQQRVRFDLEYIKNWSLFLDVKILFLTVTREIISLRAF